MKITGIIIAILTVMGMGIGGWYLARTWNYNLSYKSMVKKTIVEMVREDCLRKEEIKNEY